MYTPGLKVSSSTKLTRVRELPILGQHQVKIGDKVTANQEVLRAELPGEVEVIRVAERLGFEPIDLEGKVDFASGEIIKKGQLISSIKTFFGLYTSELHSPVDGIVEFYTETNAHLGVRLDPIPLSVDAYITGTVTKIDEGKRVYIETDAVFAQGIFGVGGERHGNVLPLDIPNEKIIDVSLSLIHI